MKPHRIVLVDDHVLFRKGLRGLLDARPEFQVVAEASNGAEGLDIIRRHSPDLVLLDLNMPEMDGLETTRRLREYSLELKIVILTVTDREDKLFQALKYGADGYLLKDLDPEDLYAAIHKVLKGEVSISGTLASKMLKSFGVTGKEEESGVEEQGPQLSQREVEVLELVSEGKTNRQIAEELYISENTVKIHMKHILEKLHARNRAEAAAQAIREGIIHRNED